MSSKINNVFTPRNSEVNLKMYVPRLALEKALLRSITGSMHSILFGESGNGKSWLYKKVLEQNDIIYTVANCANASRFKSLTSEICTTLIPSGTASKTGYTESKEASLGAVVASGKLAHQGQFKIQPDDALLSAFAQFRQRAGSRTAVLVLDNLESIFLSAELMSELADIIILLDDSRYSAFKVKLLIVGVPNGVFDYFARTKSMESVANRLEEVMKVDGLSLAMVTTLVDTGFNKLLRLDLGAANTQRVSRHVHHITMGVAQRAHEYCEKLA